MNRESTTTNEVASASGGQFGTFRAFHYPNYRYLWLGQLGHSATMWMEQVVRPLLMLELTGSALQVGLVVSLRMLPQLAFGLIAGAVADRYNKRFILLLTQTVTMLMHLSLSVLLLTGYLAVWHVYVTGFVSGASIAFNQPARQSLIPRLVPSHMLTNAVSLNTSAVNIMRVLGAGLAGVLLIFLNYGEVYLINVVVFMFVIWSTSRIRINDMASDAAEKPQSKALLSDLVDGFRYVSRKPTLLYLVGLGLLLFALGMPYQQVFVPLLAVDVLHIGRSGAGWMLALTGIGALVGSLTIASLGKLRRRGPLLMGFLVCMGGSLVLLAQSRWFPVSAVALLLAGAASTAYMASSNTLLLEQSSMEYHGRVMSLMSLDRGLASVGSIVAGALAEGMGPQPGLTVLAVTCLAFTVLIFAAVRPLRRIS